MMNRKTNPDLPAFLLFPRFPAPLRAYFSAFIFPVSFKLCFCACILCVFSSPLRSEAALTVGDAEQEILKDDIEVFTRVTGLPTAHDTYDIYAPFDGRVENVMSELFDLVGTNDVLASMVSTEMAALLDSSSEENKKQTEKRWKSVYDYFEIKPEFQGIVTNIYTAPKARVNKGDRLFTVAKKVIVIGKNTEPLYSALAPGMTAELAYGKNTAVKIKAKLINFIPLKDKPRFNRLWLEVDTLRGGIKIGEQFDGYLFVGRSENTLLVPRTALFDKSGRTYLIMEVETGLATESQTEILKPGFHFISPVYPAADKTPAEIKPPAKPMEKNDGKIKKSR
ncbi:MAG: hypothetical protein A2270_10045 [Elusimicrobia bacterium RIFOXYA12_FULL_51_18]|nr:MAG: hypothetical protein A2270_10045 [Elusimicrobia bacterium RIFOXYA12_FULL_51_18]OGS30783.1 MAG: hypothetical protein A2218_08320 [Elusimicrobia bacterium RIFOXYA2_FULL_53_38]